MGAEGGHMTPVTTPKGHVVHLSPSHARRILMRPEDREAHARVKALAEAGRHDVVLAELARAEQAARMKMMGVAW